MCPIYTDGDFDAAHAADLVQYAQEAQPSWRHPVTAHLTPSGSTAVQGGLQQATHDINHMLGQPPAAPRREMTCEFNDESAPAAAQPRPPPQAEYSIGEKVAYYSETHNTWMEATVNRQSFVDGAIISYDLDVKRGALATKIRRLPAAPLVDDQNASWEPVTPPGVRNFGSSARGYGASGGSANAAANGNTSNAKQTTSTTLTREVPTPTPVVNTALGGGGGLTPSGAPSAPEKNPLVLPVNSLALGLSAHADDADGCTQLQRFDVGDRVEYWSDTYQQWMPATVQRVRDGGSTYDLDVKRGAQAWRMRLAAALTADAACTAVSAPSRAGVATSAPGPPCHAVLASPSGQQSMPAAALASNGAVPAVAPSAAAVPDGGGASGVSFEPSRGAPLRGPSPLSGRTKSHTTPVGLHSSAGEGTDREEHSVLRTQADSAARHLGGLVGLTAAGTEKATAKQGTVATFASASPASPASATLSAQVSSSAGSHTASAGEKVMMRHSVTGDGNIGARPAMTSPFMGTGVEGRRKEAGASPIHGGRANTSMAGHRISLPGTAVSGRRDATTLVATACNGGASPSCSSSGRGLDVGELDIGSGPFDPTQQSIRSQLLAKLGLSSHATIEEMQGFRGGLNEGVWFATDASKGSVKEELVLKLVRCHRVAASIPTEAENCLRIFREHSSAVNDSTIAFPIKIFSCLGTGGTKRYDLIVMRRVRGERLAELIARKWYSKQLPQLMQILEKLGICLAEFHARYSNSQHGDFQPSNIFYDEDEDEIALIDVGGMGVPTMESDVEHFAKSMKLLAEAYGVQLSADGMRHFERGYAIGNKG